MSSSDVPSLIGNLFLMLVPAVGAVVVGLNTTGRRRALGVAGFVVSALVGLGWVGWPFMINGLDGPDSGTIFSVGGLLLTLGQSAGMVLLIMAVVARTRAPAAPPPVYPYGPPGPATYQGPWSQA
jgi:hypothetical protein